MIRQSFEIRNEHYGLLLLELHDFMYGKSVYGKLDEYYEMPG